MHEPVTTSVMWITGLFLVGWVIAVLRDTVKRDQPAKEAPEKSNIPKPNRARVLKLRHHIAIIGGIVGLLVAGMTAYNLLKPRFEISTSSRLNPSDPFTQTFEIKNSSLYALKNVTVVVFAYRTITRLDIYGAGNVLMPPCSILRNSIWRPRDR